MLCDHQLVTFVCPLLTKSRYYASFKGRIRIEFFEDIDGLADALTTKEVLIDTHERIGMILDLLPIGLIIHQKQGILFANQAASSFLDQTQKSIVGQHFLDYLDGKDADEFTCLLQDAFLTEKVQKLENVTLNLPGQSPKVMAITVAKLPWEGTPVVQILVQDITVQVARERQMKNMMATDTLTGAQNRRSFINYIEDLRRLPDIGSCGVLLWDIDFFKNVNDTFGHQAGDMALKAVVTECEQILACRALVERPDLPRPMLARFGGEEFAIIMPSADIDETLAYAEKIRRAIADSPIKTSKHEFSLTISIGAVMGDLAFDDIDMLLGLADKALYAAKENGRNQTVCAQASMPIPPDEKRISRGLNRKPGSSRVH